MLDWENVFATRSKRMRASEIRELLKLLERPDIISFLRAEFLIRLFSRTKNSGSL